MRALKTPDFLNPVLMRSLPLESIVRNGAVIVAGTTLQFKDGGYPDGTQVRVSIRREFYCESLEEIEIEKHRREQLVEESRLQNIAKLREREQQSLEFNESLKIPVAWCPEIRIVLSGLTEQSMCNGAFKNTVYHVFLLEDLEAGKLKRRRHQFLCSSAHIRFSPADYWSPPPSLKMGKVNCRQCLKIIERWKNK